MIVFEEKQTCKELIFMKIREESSLFFPLFLARFLLLSNFFTRIAVFFGFFFILSQNNIWVINSIFTMV